MADIFVFLCRPSFVYTLSISKNSLVPKKIFNFFTIFMTKVIFVYNAKSWLWSALFDWLHKVTSPSTYQCDLCSLTYWYFSMKKKWKNFLENFPYEVIFYYRDQFISQFPLQKDYSFPAIYVQYDDESLYQIIDKTWFANIATLEDLQNLLQKKLLS